MIAALGRHDRAASARKGVHPKTKEVFTARLQAGRGILVRSASSAFLAIDRSRARWLIRHTGRDAAGRMQVRGPRGIDSRALCRGSAAVDVGAFLPISPAWGIPAARGDVAEWLKAAVC
jgi:hypothetical protein